MSQDHPDAGAVPVTEATRRSLLKALEIASVQVAQQEVGLIARGSGLSVEDVRRELDAMDAPLHRIPAQAWTQFIEGVDLEPAAGTDPVEFEAVVPLWMSEGMASRGVRVRLLHSGFKSLYVHGVVRFEDMTAADEWASVQPDPIVAPEPRDPLLPPYDNPLPERWRPLVRDVVHRLVVGDYEGLQRDGIIFNLDDPESDMVKHWIEAYPDTLIDLPENAWTWSDHSPPYDRPDIYSVNVAMWTAHQGLSDLSLEGEVHDHGGDDIRVEVHSVHVM